MALKGLSLPVRASPAGRSVLASGDDHAETVLHIALSDCDSEHAFQQDEGLGEEAIFEVADENLRTRVLRRLRTIFREFESQDLYKLDDDSIEWTEAEGEQTISFSYINLESDQRKDFTHQFGGG